MAFWPALGRRSRVALAAGAAVVVLATAGAGYLLLRPQYDVLFARLSERDAAAMTRALDEMKTPYRLDDGGATILVDRASVHRTRLKLMGTDIPLQGAVGFELFNHTDFGMTEFAQRVNYQRALQGELTRTVLSIAEVASARVHLALPEEGLFRRDRERAKASVTLSLRDGRALRREQVRGIQRLIAASVPGIRSDDVTVVNDAGVALTAAEAEPGADGAAPLRLEWKDAVERHLAAKANAVLDKAYGRGEALASVDVTLDLTQVKVTREDVVAPPSGRASGTTGAIVRERETVQDGSGLALTDDAGRAPLPGRTQRETEYQLGRRVEQIVSAPGSVVRLQALAVVRAALDPAQAEQLRQLVASAVGAQPSRGDSVTVQSLRTFATRDTAGAPDPVATSARPAVESPIALPADGPAETPRVLSIPQGGFIAAVACALLATAIAYAMLRRSRRERRLPRLGDADRERHLEQLRIWLDEAAEEQPAGERI